MALEKEQIVQDIKEMLWANYSFVNLSTDHSPYVQGIAVNAPIEGSAPDVLIDQDPGDTGSEASQRTDTYARYLIHSFKTKTMRVSRMEQNALSYDKRTSGMKQMVNAVGFVSAVKVIGNWTVGAAKSTFSGSATASNNVPVGATGSRKKLTAADLSKLSLAAANDGIVGELYAAIHPVHTHELLEDSALSEAQKMGLNQSYLIDGKLPKLFGINLIETTALPVFSAGGSTLRAIGSNGQYTGVQATDVYGIVMWTPTAVASAIGSVEIFEKQGDPQFYGDVFSSEIFAGGGMIDSKGVYVCTQA